MPSLVSHQLSIIKYVVLKKIFFFLCFDRLIWTWTWTWTRTSLDSNLFGLGLDLDSNLFGLGLVLDSTKVDLTTALTHTHLEQWAHTHTHLEQWKHTHTHTHTWSSGQSTLRRPGGSWGFGALLKGLTSVVDNSCRSREPTTSDYKSSALSIRPRLHLDYNLQLYCVTSHTVWLSEK